MGLVHNVSDSKMLLKISLKQVWMRKQLTHREVVHAVLSNKVILDPPRWLPDVRARVLK